ncbi:unnamed protein product [Adineta steineri]|uniref:Endonuclease n=1 Tax=Adineta steineri TaxID=433720 RepID=A0A815TF60_9BILA|nr:unnamed protein product [Adineta steineri]
MNYQTNPLTMNGTIANQPTEILIDSGASLTLINSNLFFQLPHSIRRYAQYPKVNLQLHLADKSCLQVHKIIQLPISIANRTIRHTVHVVPYLWRSCIIGNDFIQKHNLQIDGGRQLVYFRDAIGQKVSLTNLVLEQKEEEEYTLSANEFIKIPSYHTSYVQVQPVKTVVSTDNEIPDFEVSSIQQTPYVANGIIKPQKIMHIQVANLTKKMIMVHPGQKLATMTRLNKAQLNAINQLDEKPKQITSFNTTNETALDLSVTNLSQHQKDNLQKLVQSFSDIFRKQNGRTKMIQHQIKLIPESKPCNSPPYRYSPAKRQVIEENIQEMKEEGIIEPSKSPWASPVVLTPKKDGTIRFCVDYRKLNAMTTRDAYPILRIDDTLDSLQEAKFVSTLDLRSGYWQVEMDEEAKEKTAFVTHKGLYEFNVMPYGLTNAPATFQRLMDIVLAGLKWQCCLVYIDDIVIYSPTFEQHLIDLKNVFLALREANLTLKASKCCFCRKEMKYLGHIVTQDGIKPDPTLTKAVSDFPQPKTIKDVQSFLGLSGYYRRFIKNYSKIAEPLVKQLRQLKERNYHLNWTKECTAAFETLKEKLTNAPIMSTPNFNQSFILELDACEYGLGAVLAQEYNKQKFVIAYASRTLSSAERNYGATEREALAIVWATQHFRPYLDGFKVLIRSDCKALQWLKNAKDISGRLARWAMKLSAFQIESIQYRPGTANANADSLSRNPIATTSTNSMEGSMPEVNESNEKAMRQEINNINSLNSYEISTIDTLINLWENTNILEDIKKEQQADSKLNPIVQQIKANPSPDFNDKKQPFVLINDILYKIKNSNRHYNQRILGNKHLLVIPKSMQHKLLQWAHDHPTAGHAGQQKTLFRLSTRVYWDSLRKDIYNYVAACNECQKFKYNNTPTATPIQLHEVFEPWHTIGIDLMGPFPATSRQKRFLLVIVDYFTRWVEIFPMNLTTSSAIAEILINEVFSRYGLPKYILSDNGPQFISNIFNAFCQLFTIQRKFTANYHPQTNMTERVNRTLKPLIAIFAQQHPHSWDKELYKLAFAIRTSVNETTGDTPAFLMFGRDPRIPLDLLIGDPYQDSPSNTIDQIQIQEYRTNLINNIRTAFNYVREHSEIEKLNQKMQYDRHTTQREFAEGDLVWVATISPQIGNNSLRRKLQPLYDGPCRIIEQLNPSTFTICRISDGVNLGATNINRLKTYFEPIPDSQSSLISEDNQNVEPEIINESNMDDEILRTSDQDFDTDQNDSDLEEIQMTIDQPNSKRKLIDESDSSSTEAQITTDQPRLRTPSSRKRQRPARYRDSS